MAPNHAIPAPNHAIPTPSDPTPTLPPAQTAPSQPVFSLDVLATIISHSARPLPPIGQEATWSRLHQHELAMWMRVSSACNDIARRHLYRVVVCDRPDLLVSGLDRWPAEMKRISASKIPNLARVERLYFEPLPGAQPETRGGSKDDTDGEAPSSTLNSSDSAQRSLGWIPRISWPSIRRTEPIEPDPSWGPTLASMTPAPQSTKVWRAQSHALRVFQQAIRAHSSLANLSHLAFNVYSPGPPAPRQPTIALRAIWHEADISTYLSTFIAHSRPAIICQRRIQPCLMIATPHYRTCAGKANVACTDQTPPNIHMHIHHDAGDSEYACTRSRCDHESVMGPGIRAGRTTVYMEGSARSRHEPALWYKACVWAFLVAVGLRNEAAEKASRRGLGKAGRGMVGEIAKADVRCEIVLDRKLVHQMSGLSGASLTSRAGEAWMVHAERDDQGARKAEGVVTYLRAWRNCTADRAELEHYASKLDITRRPTDRLVIKTYLDQGVCIGCTPGEDAEVVEEDRSARDRSVVVYGEW